VSLKNLKDRESQSIRQVRYLPVKYTSLGYINIYNNKIISWNTHLARAVVIEDAVISNLYKTIFELLWDICKA
jgi:hypothetical protein